MKNALSILFFLLLNGCVKTAQDPLVEFKHEFGFELPASVRNVVFCVIDEYPDYVDSYRVLWRFDCDKQTAEGILQKCSMVPNGERGHMVVPYLADHPNRPSWWSPPRIDETANRFSADYGKNGYAAAVWANGTVYMDFYSSGSHLKKNEPTGQP